MTDGELRRLFYRNGFHSGVFLRQLRVFVNGIAVLPTKSVIAEIQARPDFDYHMGAVPIRATNLTGLDQAARDTKVLEMMKCKSN